MKVVLSILLSSFAVAVGSVAAAQQPATPPAQSEGTTVQAVDADSSGKADSDVSDATEITADSTPADLDPAAPPPEVSSADSEQGSSGANITEAQSPR